MVQVIRPKAKSEIAVTEASSDPVVEVDLNAVCRATQNKPEEKRTPPEARPEEAPVKNNFNPNKR